MKGHLVLMAKAPRMGRVKTRLARGIGIVKAWAFHRRCLMATALKLKDPRWTCWASLTPQGAFSLPGWHPLDQGQGDLGRRMMKPMRELPPGPVVIVGADIPDVSRDHIAAAFEALRDNDIVFGPAQDGGFWLVGMKRTGRVIDPYDGVRWSSEHALADTLANLPDGARIGFIETLSDVDDPADYQNVHPSSSSAWRRQARKPSSLPI